MRTWEKRRTGAGSDRRYGRTGSVACGLAVLLAAIGPASGLDAKAAYPSMAAHELYLMANPAEEIALARSAAPASISNDAAVMVLGDGGFVSAVPGKNGFVCLVLRSWAASFEDAEFWNFKIRSPICYNPAAVRSVVPAELERTQWAMMGMPKAEMANRSKASDAANQTPAAGSIGYMMSKQGHLSDTDGHWHPHLMFYEPRTLAAAWGANLPGSPVFALAEGTGQVSVFVIPIVNWSDGTSEALKQH